MHRVAQADLAESPLKRQNHTSLKQQQHGKGGEDRPDFELSMEVGVMGVMRGVTGGSMRVCCRRSWSRSGRTLRSACSTRPASTPRRLSH